MSQPETNLPKQARRHWGPLAGITLALLVAAGAFFWWMAESRPPTAQESAPATTVDTDPAVTAPLAPPVDTITNPSIIPPAGGG